MTEIEDGDGPSIRPDPADPEGLIEASAAPAPGPAIARPAAPVKPVPLQEFLAAPGDHLARGPVAVILIEDGSEVASTLSHHMGLGFRKILALSPEPLTPINCPTTPKRGSRICCSTPARRARM